MDSGRIAAEAKTLNCVPESLCTWNYRVLDAAAGPGSLTFNFFSEQGKMILGSNEFEIRKHGAWSGHWTLEQGGTPVATAQKTSPFVRTFTLTAGPVEFTVSAQHAFTRRFEILFQDRQIGKIEPVHPFTRRARIQCEASIPEFVLLFSFWLAVLTWRRQQNNS